MRRIKLFLIILLIFGLLSGCTSSTNNKDPIVGSWNYTSPSVAQLAIMRFDEKGQLFISNSYYNDQLIGNWIKNSDNTYNLYFWNETTKSNSDYNVFVYDKNSDTLYFRDDPEQGFARGLALYSPSTVLTKTRTTVRITTIPAQARSRSYSLSLCREIYPGSTYNPSTDECEYNGVAAWAMTKTPTKTQTRTPSQYYTTAVTKTMTIVLSNTPTQVSNEKDPIVGTWRTNQAWNQFTFFDGGNGMFGSTYGAWEKCGDTCYAFSYSTAAWTAGKTTYTTVFTYDAKSDTIYKDMGNGLKDVYNRVK